MNEICKLKMQLRRLRKQMKNKHSAFLAASDMKNHYKELYDVAVRQVKFNGLRISHLMCVLNEVNEISGDPIICRIIKNEKERDDIDIEIHCKHSFKE